MQNVEGLQGLGSCDVWSGFCSWSNWQEADAGEFGVCYCHDVFVAAIWAVCVHPSD